MNAKNTSLVLAAAILTTAIVGGAYASFENQRIPTEYYKGHTHQAGDTVNAPKHSGGTDRYGCHNASVPYHCH
jgi:hypothetical protein